MNRAAKITVAVSAVAVAALLAVGIGSSAVGLFSGNTLAQPVVESTPASSAPATGSPEPTALPSSPPPTDGTCSVLAHVNWQETEPATWQQVAVGEPFDAGAREGASGTAHVDAGGKLVGYTVAAGDAPSVIEDRFCIDYISMLHFNGYWVTGDGKDIAPGDYLFLVPDPSVENPFL